MAFHEKAITLIFIGVGTINCDYPVQNNCSFLTTPPDFNMTGENVFWSINDINDKYISWNVTALCVRLAEGTPWKCSYGWSSLLSVNITVLPQSCTYNP